MGRFRNYISAAAGFVILAGAFTVFGPYVDQGQADPPVKDVNVVNIPLPVVVQNGNENGTASLITLAEDLEIPAAGSVELDSVEVGNFRFVSFLGISEPTNTFLVFAFSTESGVISDPIPKNIFVTCNIGGSPSAINCSSNADSGDFRVQGPFLAVKIINPSSTVLGNVTLKAYLSK